MMLRVWMLVGVAVAVAAMPGWATVRVDFEAPDLEFLPRQVVNPYVSQGITFTTTVNFSPQFEDAVVGVVKNTATVACIDAEGEDQKLGTGSRVSGVNESSTVGQSGFPIRADFAEPLRASASDPISVSVTFQTRQGLNVRLRLFDEDHQEVASIRRMASTDDGTCGLAGKTRSRVQVTARSTQDVAYALMDLPANRPIGSFVFVIDDFTVEGKFAPSSSNDLRSFDENGDCHIDDSEFLDLVEVWVLGGASDELLTEGIEAWTSNRNICASGNLTKRSRTMRASSVVSAASSSGAIRFLLGPSQGQLAEVRVYDLRGREVFAGFGDGVSLAWHRQTTNGRPLPYGVYLYRARIRTLDGTERWTPVEKLVLRR